MNDIDQNWVIVFAKRPEPGKVKTRLSALLGPDGACRLYDAFLADTTLTVASLSHAHRVMACDPPHEQAWFYSRFHESFEVTSQGQGDFGKRLERSFDEAFARSANRVIVVGSDLPTLSPECLAAAFEDLKSHDLVLGPADDGGYYLIGLSRPAPELFQHIDWSTERVLGQTVERAGRSGLSLKWFPTECDVDDETGLRKLVASLSACSDHAPNTRRVLSELRPMLNTQETRAWK